MTVIIDTGCANFASVQFALKRLGCNAQISADPATILSADRLILPGVGSAQAAMQKFTERGISELLPQIEQPLLGICLGMQLLGEFSQEGNTALPGLLPVQTERLHANGQPLPHMGWNRIGNFDHPLFSGINHGDYVYFVHSYAVPVGELTIAQSNYGQPFSAAIGRDNLLGVQFHPERSSAVGARILKNFLEISL
ncbi:imidazole glycerol phosphate synthase subunit HisH [Ferrimonas lipolytica]|uniref:Imidazole glycerol phosphate synthase subunit HisH n=1 Tax=Ferrimonas lipolytica TaxID=2724191 RepID=A0A6H1UEI7_9GAMM|nr:imidazole glycerol phosphate synthase subunit HisH [Ferrimonas lipolytica]QIZ76753.1 imidazole glycerol phosphate synthase subunit HisH [Ferrimonas lipolytica]